MSLCPSISIRQGTAGKGKPGVEVFPGREEPQIQHLMIVTQSEEGWSIEAIIVFILVFWQDSADAGGLWVVYKASKTLKAQHTIMQSDK